MPKITLQNVTGNSYFCSGVLSIGVYLHDRKALLIDSGADDSCAKDVFNALDEQGISVEAIINTHCHPDHCGGNSFFQKKYPDLKVFAAHDETRFIEDPNLAPRCFCSLAAPFAGLKNKYLAPQRLSVVTNPITPYIDQNIEILSTTFRIITLPGHTPGSIGIITPDNVFYTGDALFGKETLQKHAILFYTDIENTLASFTKLTTLQVGACVFYHGGIAHDLAGSANQHAEKILATKNSVYEIIRKEPISLDLLTQSIMQKHSIPNSIVSFTLTQTAMRAYLTKLESEKVIELQVRDGLLQAIAIN